MLTLCHLADWLGGLGCGSLLITDPIQADSGVVSLLARRDPGWLVRESRSWALAASREGDVHPKSYLLPHSLRGAKMDEC